MSTPACTARGGTVRTVLLDDRGYVALLRLYLARSGYTSGPLFRASINGRGGPLSYYAAHNRLEEVLPPPPAPGSASTSSATRTPPS